jgi:hypothetical protein
MKMVILKCVGIKMAIGNGEYIEYYINSDIKKDMIIILFDM